MKKHKRIAAGMWLCVLLATLGSAVALGESLKGKVKKNVYYSPAKNFSVPIPSMLGVKVNDGYRERGPGAVSFHGDFGIQRGIHYMPLRPDEAAKFQAAETQEAALKSWLHEAAMPTWFLPVSEKSRVLNEGLDTFEGMKVLLAKVVIPEGSPMVVFQNGRQRRADSVRGLVVFQRGGYVYMLTSQSFIDKDEDSTGGWKKFAEDEKLKSFYQSIAFAE